MKRSKMTGDAEDMKKGRHGRLFPITHKKLLSVRKEVPLNY